MAASGTSLTCGQYPNAAPLLAIVCSETHGPPHAATGHCPHVSLNKVDLLDIYCFYRIHQVAHSRSYAGGKLPMPPSPNSSKTKELHT